MHMEKKKSFIVTYVITGTFCFVWAVAAVIKALFPAVYNYIARGGGFIWFCYYILLPIAVLAIGKDIIAKSYKADIAYFTLLGCSEGIMCMEWIAHSVTVPGYLYAPVVLIGGVCGHIAGVMRFSPERCMYCNEKVTAGDVFGGMIYGLAAGTVLSMSFLRFFSVADRSIAVYFSFCGVAAVSVIFPFVMCFVYKRREKEYTGFRQEMENIISRLDRYDKDIKRCRAERDAREAKERAEKVARERAERERRAHKEAERERRERKRYEKSRQEQTHGGRGRSTGQASWEKLAYFNGCKTKTELKRRYHQLCKKLHPDCGGNVESFRKMQAEYDMVSSRMAG